ncbi:hypothetical protein LNN35_20625 [Pseudomonas stutzeri]|jgi:hypothetical protein|uniref:hypothetical protein n=1 Tax=Stutzerimonas stutzeri TaxID=316 RepID=UPI001E3FA87D|nr:hypothetical protein [Stutzerimonas stutzeri]MCC8345170.1 hypothetical protein [Stutzerimonas stutzeri]
MENLKVKVILGYSVLATFLGMIYQPEVVRALMPLALCVVLAAFAMYAPDIIRAVTTNLKSRRSYTMASKTFRVKCTTPVPARVTAVPSIDYDNYIIPTYLRCQEVK